MEIVHISIDFILIVVSSISHYLKLATFSEVSNERAIITRHNETRNVTNT